MNKQNTYDTLTIRQMQMLCTLESLWIEHVLWTRSFIVSTVFNLTDLKPVTDRLLRNPSDFSDALLPYYGGNARRFGDLLKEHLLIAAELVNAAKAGNKKAVDEQRTKWYANADTIAGFLGGINPYWSKETWRSLLYDHLKMTEDEAVMMLGGRYADAIKKYDSIQDEAIRMGEYMAAGIMDQFKV